MAIRPTLKSYFVTNNIPTEDNFEELIDNSLLQTEDGIRKPADGPIELAAQETTGELLRLYGSFDDRSPALWTFSHKPTGKGKTKATGLNIADAQESRLFIKAEDGNVGIGTPTPAQKLDVAGGILARGHSAIGNQGAYLQWNRSGNEGEAWLLNQKGEGKANAGIRFGTADTNDKVTEWARFNENGAFGIGTEQPATRLQVVSADNEIGTNIFDVQAKNLSQGVGLWWGGIRKTGTNPNGTIALDAKGNGAVLLNASGGTGNVGIGTPEPGRTLDVLGSIGLRNKGADWDHLFLHHDGATALMTAGGAENGLAFRVGNAGSGAYDKQPYAEVMRLMPGGNVGIGTTTPFSRVSMGSTVAANAPAGRLAIYEGNTGTNFYGLGLVQKPNGEYGMGLWGGTNSQLPYNGSGGQLPHLYLDQVSAKVGIGTITPVTTLDVRTSDATAAITVGQTGGGAGALYFGNANHGVQRGYPKLGNDNNVGLYTTAGNLYLSGNGTSTSHLMVANNGFVGIGISNNGNPEFPLDVRGSAGMGYSATYAFLNGKGAGANHVDRLTDVSIRATNRVVAAEFNANSDARLKTVVGRSDSAADLALLRRLRITDYTMRDRVQFGDRAFKKIIGQELEEVLPQVVHQNVGFLPDIYASASQVQRQGEALLLALPAGLPEAATAGQRLKLVGPVGEIIATLAEPAAAGSQQLLVAGANELADTPNEVFVFGLEHPNVRSVDYEAVAMLNVSATQALARQVEALHQQNAALNEQSQAQRAELDALHATLRLLQQQLAQLLREPGRVAQPA